MFENESIELRDSHNEGIENFPDLPQRSELDVECGGSLESPEKKIGDIQVMPVGEVSVESAEKVNVLNLTNILESVQCVSPDDSHIIVSPLISESLDVLDDCEVQQLVEIAPVQFAIVLEGEWSTVDFRRVATGQFTEHVTFQCKASDLETGNRTSC